MRCPICERFIFAHTDEEATWCYRLFHQRTTTDAAPPTERRPEQTAWLSTPISRDSVQ